MSWTWNGIEIPEKWCFAAEKDGKRKKCTPDCSSYDLGWLYPKDNGDLPYESNQ